MDAPLILVTGFGPFENVEENPSARLVERLDADPPESAEIAARILPVSFRGATSEIDAALAALEPRRPAAMLAVAVQFPDSAQADLAIVAGAAAALSLRDGGNALPQLKAWHELEEQDDDWGWLPAAVIEGLWRQLEHREFPERFHQGAGSHFFQCPAFQRRRPPPTARDDQERSQSHQPFCEIDRIA